MNVTTSTLEYSSNTTLRWAKLRAAKIWLNLRRGEEQVEREGATYENETVFHFCYVYMYLNFRIRINRIFLCNVNVSKLSACRQNTPASSTVKR